jgi:hypothetical protein
MKILINKYMVSKKFAFLVLQTQATGLAFILKALGMLREEHNL